MATSTMQRQKTGSWSAIFPTEQVTQQQSALFVKKLLAVAISNITYLRTIFPEHAFGDRCLEDLNLKILRDDSACPGACQVIQWVKGCFDALDKQYLRMVVVGIYAENTTEPLTAVETYTFKFDYSDNKGVTIFRNDTEVASAFTETETKRATIKLLRTIIVLTQTLQPLPDDVMMTMKLCYYDDVTPEEYEPPGFQPTNSEDFVFEENPVSIRVGDVSTPFHVVKLRIKTKRSQFSGADTTENLDRSNTADCNEGVAKNVVDTPNKAKDMAVGGDGVRDTVTADVGKAIGTAHEPNQQEHCTGEGDSEPKAEVEEEEREEKEDGEENQDIPSSPKVGKRSTVHAAEDNTVICPCGINEDDGLMVLCGVCQVWQHAVCYSLLEEEHVPDFHVCVTCAKNGCGDTCTDPTLISLSHTYLQSTCLWRRSLQACLNLSRVLPSGLARRLGVSVPVAQGILERLEHEGYVRTHGKKRLGRQVMKEKLLAEGMPKYLSLPLKLNNGTRSSSKRKPTTTADTHTTDSTKPQKYAHGVESLAHKASHLDISTGARREPEKGDVPSAWKKPHKALGLPRQREIDDCEVRRSPRIMAKRVRSVVDETQEFEVSSSQEPQQQGGGVAGGGGGRGSKRRKLSIASHPIMV